MPRDKYPKLDYYVDFLEKLVAECYSSQSDINVNQIGEKEFLEIRSFYRYAEENMSLKPQEFAIDKRLVTCRTLVNQLMKLKNNSVIKIDEETIKYIQFIIELVDIFRPYVLNLLAKKEEK